MTIVYLHPHFTIAGGSGRFVLETAERLARRGHDVHIVTIRADKHIIGELSTRVRFHEIGGALSSQLSFWLTFPQSCSRVEKVISRIDNPILFPQVFPSNWWGFHAKKRWPHIPCVWFCHEPSAFIHSRTWIDALPTATTRALAKLGNPFFRRLDTSLAQHVDLVITNSHYTRSYAQRIYGYCDELIRSVYLGVDERRFSAGAFADRKKSVVTIARLTRFKNIDTIIRAIALMIVDGPANLQLHVIGLGDAQPGLEKLAVSLGVDHIVRFHGAVDDQTLVQTLRQARAFVLASVDEPFGLVTVEAMACGTPAVVVNSGGPAEVVLDGECGYQVPPQDPQILAQRLSVLMTDDVLFARLSEGALKRAGHFNWARTVDDLERSFEVVHQGKQI